MPEQQLERMAFLLVNTPSFHAHAIAGAGHFAATDAPLRITEELLKFMRSIVGVGSKWRKPSHDHHHHHAQGLADVFFGLTSLWKGDERELFEEARRIAGVDV